MSLCWRCVGSMIRVYGSKSFPGSSCGWHWPHVSVRWSLLLHHQTCGPVYWSAFPQVYLEDFDSNLIYLWQFNLKWRGFCVSPTYRLLHLWHSIKYTTLLVLQFAVVRAWNFSPAAVLKNLAPIFTCVQVLQWGLPHWRVPSLICSGGFNVALTKRSFRFFGRLYTTRGGFSTTWLIRSKTCRTGRCRQRILCKSGKFGW